LNPIRTRIATISDLDDVALLFDAYRQFYQQVPALAKARRFIQERIQNRESVILLATREDQKIVGFCQLYPSFCSVEAKPIYVLYDLYVTPEARRTGVGTLLLRAAETLAAERGMARLDLTTAKVNTPAQAVYESLGWVRDEVFYAYSKHIREL
jgi:ribosomal protein S18 acetylase RimI-like enzyme